MNFLEKIINGIYQRHLRKRKEKEERIKAKLEKQEMVEKIYQAISDFIKKDNFDIRQHRDGYSYGEYKFNLGKTEIVVDVDDCGQIGFDYRAAVKVNSIWLDAPKRLKRKLAAEINESINKKEEEEKEKIIKEAAKSVGKKYK